MKNKKAEGALEQLAELARSADPDQLFGSARRKRERLFVRIDAARKREMQAAAEVLDISVSEYLLRIHEAAFPGIMATQSKRRKKA